MNSIGFWFYSCHQCYSMWIHKKVHKKNVHQTTWILNGISIHSYYLSDFLFLKTQNRGQQEFIIVFSS